MLHQHNLTNFHIADQLVDEEHQARENAHPEEVHHVTDSLVTGEG